MASEVSDIVKRNESKEQGIFGNKGKKNKEQGILGTRKLEFGVWNCELI
jgi:hypothetical protein